MTAERVYVCGHCGEPFSLDESGSVRMDGEDWTACPSCGSTYIEEAVRCPVCRQIVLEHKLRGGVCPECFRDAVDSYKTSIGYLQPWERDALEIEYGNIDITEN